MSARAIPKLRTWSTFGPFLILETVPWLMLAAALRIVAYGGGLVAVLAYVAASVALFLAFLLAARRLVEAADGQTDLGALAFGEQLKLARRVLWQIIALMIGVYLALKWAGLPTSLAKHALAGFDGIAFDQFTVIGRLWSACLAALVLLMILRADQGQKPSLVGAGRELMQRWSYLAAAILAVFVFHLLLVPIQGYARWLVVLMWKTDAMPELKRVVFFCFIFAFASIRLWITITILTFALRMSYRASGSAAPQWSGVRSLVSSKVPKTCGMTMPPAPLPPPPSYTGPGHVTPVLLGRLAVYFGLISLMVLVPWGMSVVRKGEQAQCIAWGYEVNRDGRHPRCYDPVGRRIVPWSEVAQSRR